MLVPTAPLSFFPSPLFISSSYLKPDLTRLVHPQSYILILYLHRCIRSHMCAVDGTPRLLVCPDRCAEGVPFAGPPCGLVSKCYCSMMCSLTPALFAFINSSYSPISSSYYSAECGCQVDKLVNNETTWQNLLPCVLGSPSDRYPTAAPVNPPHLHHLSHLYLPSAPSTLLNFPFRRTLLKSSQPELRVHFLTD